MIHFMPKMEEFLVTIQNARGKAQLVALLNLLAIGEVQIGDKSGCVLLGLVVVR